MLQLITLHLARSSEFPAGSLDRGYEMVAPIDALGHLDPKSLSGNILNRRNHL